MKFFKIVLLTAVVLLFCSSCTDSKWLTFDTNGGPKVKAQLLKPNEEASLPVDYDMDGYDFAGWYLDEDVWEQPYNGEPITENTTVHARWDVSIHNVVFYLNGGQTADGTSRQYKAEVVEGDVITPPEVTNTDKELIGWYTDPSCTVLWEGGVCTGDTKLYARWRDYFDSEDMVLPRVYFTTSKEKFTLNGEYSSCYVTVTSDNKEWNIYNEYAGYRVRGNSTAGFEKKPYRVKFEKKRDMFGMGAAKDWIFLANYIDISLMRNWITFELAAHFGDKYTTSSQMVNLFIDGEYQGVYLVCEQVETGVNRVDIEWDELAGPPDDPADVGFLVEFGNPGFNWGDWSTKFIMTRSVKYKGRTYRNDGGEIGVIKYPNGDDCTNEMAAYLQEYVDKVNTAIFTRDWESFSELCDVDSFVINFIVSEYMLSNDMGWVFFFYKEPGGKLALGPIWDFDQSAGCSTHGGDTYKGWASGTPHSWFLALIEIDEFRSLVIERWMESYDYLHSVPDIIQAKADECRADIDANFIRWDRLIGYPHWRSIPKMDKFKTYDEHVDYLKEWLNNRMNWIETELGIKN
jgi:hypothetical protein